MIDCCRECVAPKRYPGCHDRCEEYITQRKAEDERKAKEFKENEEFYANVRARERKVRRGYKQHKKAYGKWP